VTSIGSHAFYNCTSLASIELPDNVTSIGDSAFYNCTSLTAVYFTCGEADVPDITVGVGNDPFLNATHYYYTETQPTTEGNFWCYDSKGGIAIWKLAEFEWILNGDFYNEHEGKTAYLRALFTE
jgi:hypothetical protein